MCILFRGLAFPAKSSPLSAFQQLLLPTRPVPVRGSLLCIRRESPCDLRKDRHAPLPQACVLVPVLKAWAALSLMVAPSPVTLSQGHFN